MFYTIYKITNNINGKFYIGKHQTKDLDDGYMGSGKWLKRAIKKYGIDNFHKEILHICSTEKEMDLLEKILVVPDPEISYNLCDGGQGGFSYINRNKKNRKYSNIDREKSISACKEKWKNDIVWIEKQRLRLSIQNKGNKSWLGKSKSEESKLKHSEYMSGRYCGKDNSQYGTCWITNGQENKKIKKDELDNWLEKGYYKGRK